MIVDHIEHRLVSTHELDLKTLAQFTVLGIAGCAAVLFVTDSGGLALLFVTIVALMFIGFVVRRAALKLPSERAKVRAFFESGKAPDFWVGYFSRSGWCIDLHLPGVGFCRLMFGDERTQQSVLDWLNHHYPMDGSKR